VRKLTVEQILDWADWYHRAMGRWPRADSGPVAGVPRMTWSTIDYALSEGRKGLAGRTTLRLLLLQHRGDQTMNRRPDLTIERILGWADAHFESQGCWPNRRSGRVPGAPAESWHTIDSRLRDGRRGLPGGSSLARLLAERRGALDGRQRPLLCTDQIVAWADAHHAATGKWPSARDGAVTSAPGERWSAIDHALTSGSRGLPGGSSLARLLAEHRGAIDGRQRPPLCTDQIVAWADAHHAATGKWPSATDEAVADAPGERWSTIDNALTSGRRGLPGGSSLARLLAEHRGVLGRRQRPPLCIDQIIAWADAHYAATGKWPSATDEAVTDAPGERWSAIDRALIHGRRGLQGGSSLNRLLNEHRPSRKVLTLEMIRAWGAAHHAATGRWPNTLSGTVTGAPGMTWHKINRALHDGCRGLPRGTRLGSVFQSASYTPRPYNRHSLSLEQVLAWADAHHAATGRWPRIDSGAIAGAPGESWVNINQALNMGRRGLPSGLSLARLFAGRTEDPAVKHDRQALTVDQILAWGDAHFRATGRWPTVTSGVVRDAPGEKWVNINEALRGGYRGLPAGVSLAKLFAGRPAPDDVGQTDRNRRSGPA
jgi:hypothetical protein